MRICLINTNFRIQNKTAINMCEVGADLSCQDVFVFPQTNGWVNYKMDIKFNKYKTGKGARYLKF